MQDVSKIIPLTAPGTAGWWWPCI